MPQIHLALLPGKLGVFTKPYSAKWEPRGSTRMESECQMFESLRLTSTAFADWVVAVYEAGLRHPHTAELPRRDAADHGLREDTG